MRSRTSARSLRVEVASADTLPRCSSARTISLPAATRPTAATAAAPVQPTAPRPRTATGARGPLSTSLTSQPGFARRLWRLACVLVRPRAGFARADLARPSSPRMSLASPAWTGAASPAWQQRGATSPAYSCVWHRAQTELTSSGPSSPAVGYASVGATSTIADDDQACQSVVHASESGASARVESPLTLSRHFRRKSSGARSFTDRAGHLLRQATAPRRAFER